jgi:hypothetical protein
MGNPKQDSGTTGVLETIAKVKINCWEHKKCGRQPGGHKAADLGVCPVTTYADLNGAHGGQNAGRACWVIAGSLCGGKIQGTYAAKLLNCWRCEFMNAVKLEEEPTPVGFSHTRLGLDKTVEKMRHAVGVVSHDPNAILKRS